MFVDLVWVGKGLAVRLFIALYFLVFMFYPIVERADEIARELNASENGDLTG